MAQSLAETTAMVHNHLRSMVAGIALTDDGNATFPFGSTHVTVSVVDDEELSAPIVHVAAVIAQSVPVSPSLDRWFINVTSSLQFGSLSAVPLKDRSHVDLGIRHSILGAHLDPPELRVAVAFVASTADDLDDYVTDHFGGTRYSDL